MPLDSLCRSYFRSGVINLAPGLTVDCEVEVRHCTDQGIGVKIDFMDDQNCKAYQGYLQEFFSQQLNKLG